MVLDTKQAPQSGFGRYNIVMEGVYQHTIFLKKWVGFYMKKGAFKLIGEIVN